MASREIFEALRQGILDEEIYKAPDSLFYWAIKIYPDVEGGDFTPDSFAFQLFDRISETKNAEAVMRRAVAYADAKFGIKPWPNVQGLRLEASSCLSQFIEGCLRNSQ